MITPHHTLWTIVEGRYRANLLLESDGCREYPELVTSFNRYFFLQCDLISTIIPFFVANRTLIYTHTLVKRQLRRCEMFVMETFWVPMHAHRYSSSVNRCCNRMNQILPIFIASSKCLRRSPWSASDIGPYSLFFLLRNSFLSLSNSDHSPNLCCSFFWLSASILRRWLRHSLFMNVYTREYSSADGFILLFPSLPSF